MSADKRKKEASKRAVLEFRSGPFPSEMIKLRRDATIFGREKGDIIIDDNEVSATHCQIQCIDGMYHIFDMNSTNGTFVNNEKVVKAKLVDGDSVTIGSTTFSFSLKEEKEIRHIATIFKSKKDRDHQTSSIVDTLIESELQSTQSKALKLQVTYRNGKTEDLVLRQRIVYIGRASSFGQFDQDTEISRKHLLIKLNDSGEVFIEDQGSTNGTFLNGTRIKGMHLISEQDVIRVGGTQIKVSTKSQ